MRVCVRLVLACSVGFAMLAIHGPAAAEQRAAAEPPAAAEEPMTKIRILVSDCEGCTIGLERALAFGTRVTPEKPRYYTAKGSGKVSGGKVVFTVPTAVTPGMSLTISAPWQGFTDYQTNVVLSGWDGDTSAPFIPGGEEVSKAEARKRKLGSSCWAGTTKSKATIRVSVAKIKVPGLGTTKRVTTPLAWASPTKRTITPYANESDGDTGMGELYKGTSGNQDAFYC